MPSREAFYELPEPIQEEWIATWEAEQDICQHHGGPLSECPDEEADWFPQLVVCQPTMQRQAAVALYEQLHQERPYHDGTHRNWSSERTSDYPYHFGDGVSIFMSQVDLGLGGDFLQQGDPLASIAEQADTD